MTEVSRNVVAALLVLVIVVSGFGTYSLLSRETDSQANGLPAANSPAGGRVALDVEQPQSSQTGATFSMTIAGPTNG
jgi:hypothetical protein